MGDEEAPHDVKLSKHLTKVLRHKAMELGIQIDGQGWALVADVVQCVNAMERTASGSSATQWTEDGITHRFGVVHMNNKER